MPEEITVGSPKKPTNSFFTLSCNDSMTIESITASIEATTREMVVIATLKESIASYLSLDDIYDHEEDTTAYYCFILGRLEMSLMRRKQLLDEDRKALLELKDE